MGWYALPPNDATNDSGSLNLRTWCFNSFTMCCDQVPREKIALGANLTGLRCPFVPLKMPENINGNGRLAVQETAPIVSRRQEMNGVNRRAADGLKPRMHRRSAAVVVRQILTHPVGKALADLLV